MLDIRKSIKEQGFLVIPNAIPQEIIIRLRQATDNILQGQKFSYDFLKIDNRDHIHKIKYMYEKDDIFVQTLAQNSILAAVTSIFDDPASIVPTWEDMLIKVPYSGIPVTVHQDLALQSAKGDVFSLGVYLHDSHHNPVNYLPGSHKLGPLTKDEIYEVYHQGKKDFEPVKVKAGDISIHNVKTVHYSEENTSKYPRYTWYLEFRTREQLLEDSPWDETWINSRRAIWAHTLKRFHKNIDHLIPDYQALEVYMNPLNLRICHTNDKIQYDLKSPYNHFI